MIQEESDTVMHTHDPSTWEVETGGSGVQDHSPLNSESEDSLGYMNPAEMDETGWSKGYLS